MTESIDLYDLALTALVEAGALLPGEAPEKPEEAPERRLRYVDPMLFVHEVLKVPDVAPYQERIMRTLLEKRRLAVRGPHGLGKTAVAAWIVCWFCTAFPGRDVKIITTASAWRQLTDYLWPEIRKWALRADWSQAGLEVRDGREILLQEIHLPEARAVPVASNNAAFIEGAHAQVLLYIVDEGKAVPDPTWNAIEGAMSSGECYWLALSTPGDPAGRYYDICSHKPGYEDWTTLHITLEEAIAAGRVSREWADKRKEQWGEESPVYQTRVLGNFAVSGEDTVIPLSWIEAAVTRYQDRPEVDKRTGPKTYGLDVAYTGADNSVLCYIQDNVGEMLESRNREDTMVTAGRVASHLGEDKNSTVAVDVNGVGAGVYGRLKEQGYSVMSINSSSSTDFHDSSGELKFLNLRAGMWWAMRETLDPNNPVPFALPPDERLIGDLAAPRWEPTSRGEIKVESKDDIRARLGRSTDFADAMIMANYARGRRLLLPVFLEW